MRIVTRDFITDATGWISYIVTMTTKNGKIFDCYRVIYTIEDVDWLLINLVGTPKENLNGLPYNM
jgi:hypothetical protein